MDSLVDHSGDLHDPDYRHFPVLPAPKKRVTSPTRRSSTNSNAKRRSLNANPSLYASSIASSTRRASSGSTIAAMNDRYSTYPLVARPEWEREWATEAELDEDDEDDQDDDDEDDNESINSLEEQYSYDPEILTEADVEWIQTIHVLGLNPNAGGIPK